MAFVFCLNFSLVKLLKTHRFSAYSKNNILSISYSWIFLHMNKQYETMPHTIYLWRMHASGIGTMYNTSLRIIWIMVPYQYTAVVTVGLSACSKSGRSRVQIFATSNRRCWNRKWLHFRQVRHIFRSENHGSFGYDFKSEGPVPRYTLASKNTLAAKSHTCKC
jgi:hypothetical protein